ncbi:MAG: hypothetical protein JWN67_4758 [Actinomycetia bacterium]|nr:hypothetical protein [Actinomycetes bacterium]
MRNGQVDHLRVKSLLAAAVIAVTLAVVPAASAATGPVVGIATTPSGTGHWVVDGAGRVTVDGDATSYGSRAGRTLQQPIVGVAGTTSGRGYWLVARDGGIFSFGDARFLGSTGAIRLNQPIVGMAATPSGAGYWLVARDGGIFSYGDARFLGSTGAIRLNQPIVGMAATASGRGYWLAAADGGIFSYGDARFLGAGPKQVTAVAGGAGYALATAGGTVASFRPGQPATTTAPARDAALWPFASTSPWNLPIGSGATYESVGDARTATLLSTARSTAWVNAEQYSHPVYRASATDPVVTVRRSGFADVTFRLPVGATPAAGSDRHLHVVDPTGRWLDEDWHVIGTAPALTTGYHVRTDLYGPGVGQGGVRAYGGSAVGGLIRTWELEQGTIRHALALALEADQLGRGPVWPATAEDGDAARSYTGNVPMGTLAAIPPSIDVNRLGLSPAGLAAARALQDYGAYVVDRSGCTCLYAEPTAPRTAVSDLRKDVAKLRSLLRVVTDNRADNVGGGGTRRAPLAPALP